MNQEKIEELEKKTLKISKLVNELWEELHELK